MYARKGKLGVSWYSDFIFEGKRYKKAWGRVPKTIAKEKEIKFKSDIARGKYEGVKKNILFDRLVEKYLEYSKVNKRYKSYLSNITSTNALLKFFKGKRLNEIHPFLLERYKKERLKTVKPASLNRDLSCLKHMFNMAMSWNLAKENPAIKVKLLKEEKRDVKVLTYEKEKELIDVLSEHPESKHVSDIVLVGLYSGMRVTEIFDLPKDDIDFKNRMIHVKHTKNWEVRDIPMNELLTKVLKEAIDKSPKDSPYVFPNPKTGKPYTSIKTSFKKAVKKIGLQGFRFHDLRHSWCSRMCELGVDEATIRELGGWKTKNMIDRYAHPSMNHKREAVEKLEKVPLNSTLNKNQDHTPNLNATLNSDNIKVI